jgi:hypothetical protein
MIPEQDHDGRSRQVRRREQRKEDPLKKDFRLFLHVVWKHLGLPKPTPVQLDIARYMQHGPRRKMVQAFRGVGKTWVYAAFVCWRFYCNPEWKIMVVSATKQTADDFSRFVKRLIQEMPLLNHLIPGDDQRNSNVFFDVGPAKPSKDPSLKSVGITGQITGSRADEILADDIESLNNSATEGARERLSEAVKEFDAVLKPGGVITYLGTPQSAMTMYTKLPERGYNIRIWPARVPEDPTVYNGQLAPFIYRMIEQGRPVGTSTDPDRFTDQDLDERERSYGPAGFALQFMLNTSLNDSLRFPLKLQDLITMPLDPHMAPAQLAWSSGPEHLIEGVHVSGLPGDKFYGPMFVGDTFLPYTGAVMAIDPSGRGQDETAYAVVKHLNGMQFLTAAGGLVGGYEDDTLDALVDIAKAQMVNLMLVEENFGGGMFAKLLQAALKRKQYLCKVEEVRHSKQKEMRIADTIEPVLAQHRLVVCKTLINRDFESATEASYSLFWQMTRLTRERGCLKHDDRLDALSMAIAYWVEQMAQNSEDAFAKHQEKLRDEVFKDFIKEVRKGLGTKRNGKRGKKRFAAPR